MLKSMRKLGFSLIEMMVVLALVGSISVGSMSMFTNLSKSFNSYQARSELIELTYEVTTLLQNPDDCDASFNGISFNGSTLNSNPVNVDIWSTDQTGTPLRMRFSSSDPTANSYGKIDIIALNFSMPLYTSVADFPAGDFNFPATLELKVDIDGKIKTQTFPNIMLAFTTNVAGVSTISSCVYNQASGLNHRLPPLDIKMFNPGLVYQCQDVDLTSHCSDEDGCRIHFKMYKKDDLNDLIYHGNAWIYFESPSLTQNNDPVGIHYYTTVLSANSSGVSGNGTLIHEMVNFYKNNMGRNYLSALCPTAGGVNGPAFANPYQINIQVLPRYNGHFTIYD